MTPTVNFIFDTRFQKKDKTYPVKLSVYYQGTKKLYNSGFSFTQAQWQKLNGEKLRDEFLKRKKALLYGFKSKAEELIEKITPFSFDIFGKRFANSTVGNRGLDVYQLFDEEIQELRADDRIGSAIAYETAKKSLQNYKKTLSFIEVSASFLKNYERAQIKQGLSSTTIGIYLRQLRAIYNRAIEQNIIEEDLYPFKSYTIPSSKNIKKALSSSDIQKLLKYNPATEGASKALDFWKFSYLVYGINISDIARLKYENINGGIITFYRGKTKYTARSGSKPIKAAITPW
jgi:integrase